MSLQHRGDRIPLRAWLACRMVGHAVEHLPSGWWLCTRCTRIARTPVELP